MRPIPLAFAAGLAAVLVQACDDGDDQSGGSVLASCAFTPTYMEDDRRTPSLVEGSSATYRIERADGTTEDVSATVSSIGSDPATGEDMVTFVLEGDAGAYSVTDDLDCYDYDAPGARPRRASDVENDLLARALVAGGPRFDESFPPPPGPDEERPPVPEPEPAECLRLDGSNEVELFAERATSRCTLTARPDPDGEEIMLVVEVALEGAPVTGLIFKERVRANGEIDRMRLIDWNGL